MQAAPWPDFAGNTICEGDVILHPSGERGLVVLLDTGEPSDRWRVDYGSGDLSRLCLQIGEKGQAVVTLAASSPTVANTTSSNDR